jgi:hypothetical protein
MALRPYQWLWPLDTRFFLRRFGFKTRVAHVSCMARNVTLGQVDHSHAFEVEPGYLSTGWTAWVRSPTEEEDFSSAASRPALRPTQPPIQWVPGVLSPGVNRGRGVMLTTHPLLVPWLRKTRSYTSSNPERLHGM